MKTVLAWMPGIKDQAKMWRKQLQEFIDRPYEATKTSLVRREYQNDLRAVSHYIFIGASWEC